VSDRRGRDDGAGRAGGAGEGAGETERNVASGAVLLDDDEGYRQVRSGVAVVPGRRDVVLVTGPDALGYLQGQCSQDLAGLGETEAADALLLSPQGKLEALVRVTRLADDRFAVDVDGGFGDVVVARLQRFKLRVAVEVTAVAWSVVSLRGPRSAEVAAAAVGVEAVVPWAWGGAVGCDLLGPAATVPEGIGRVSDAVAAALRVEAGVPMMGAELDERTIPAEAGLTERAVSFTKGCYTGQELVARLDARGNRVARHLRGLVLAAPAEAGWTICDEQGPLGQLTTVAWSPALDAVAALGFVHRRVTPPAPVSVRSVADDPTGEVAAEVRTLPLVETGAGSGPVTADR
jgi:folate-binding protein YgfZ